MTFPESEFVDLMTLARLYDASKTNIKEVLRELLDAGHVIETVQWGKQRKLKVCAPQFRQAVYNAFVNKGACR